MRLALLLLLVACQRSTPESAVAPAVAPAPDVEAPAPKPAAAPPPLVAACPPPVACPAPAPPALSKTGVSVKALLSGLPSFEPARVSRGSIHTEQAHLALRSVNPDDLDQIVPAVHAVIADPGDVQARFLLACTLAQHGLHEHARAELHQIAGAKRCPACTDALANTADPFCGFDDKAKELAAAAGKPSRVHVAAVQILASINSGDTSKIEGYLEGTSVMDNACGVCDEPMSTKKVMSRAAFLTFVRGAEERFAQGPYIYNAPLLLFCNDRCCAGPRPWATHTQIMVDSICFRGPADAPKLDVISTTSG